MRILQARLAWLYLLSFLLKLWKSFDELETVYTPCTNLFWVVLVLRRTGGWQLFDQYALIVFRRIRTYWSKHTELSTTDSFQNQHYSKEIFTWCYHKHDLVILPLCKVSTPTGRTLLCSPAKELDTNLITHYSQLSQSKAWHYFPGVRWSLCIPCCVSGPIWILRQSRYMYG